MSYQIYVGNYPKEFTEEDLNRIFLDFEGIRLVKFFKAEKKCFAFFYCLNREQVIDVCMKMNNLLVGGRKLIVRATDDNLQAYIKKTIEYLSESSYTVGPGNSEYEPYAKECTSYSDMPKLEPFNIHETSTANDYSSDSHFYMPSNKESNARTQHEINPRSDKALPECLGKYRNSDTNPYSTSTQFHSHETCNYERNAPGIDTFSGMSHSEQYKRHGNLRTNSELQAQYNAKSHDHKLNYQGIQSISDMPCLEPSNIQGTSPKNKYAKEEQFYASHKCNHAQSYSTYSNIYERNGQCSGFCEPSTSESQHYQPQTQLDLAAQLSYVSVMNFPIGTTYEELYKLFSEFNPIEIIFKCNVARRDRTPTEAYVYFTRKQDATDAILTLDNTRYKNRIILVNDLDDLTMAMELLSVAGKH